MPAIKEMSNGNRHTGKVLFDNGMTAANSPTLTGTGTVDSLCTILAGTAVTNTTTETVAASATIKKNTLAAGRGVRFRFMLRATATNSTDTLVAKLYLGNTTLTTSFLAGSAADVVNNCTCVVSGEFWVDSVGASGRITGNAFLSGFGTAVTAQSAVGTAYVGTLDTTSDILLEVSLTWSVASSSDSAQSEKIYIEYI